MVFGAKKLWPFKGEGPPVVELEPELDIAEPEFGAPRLTMLVADASGFASFKEHTFYDAETAAQFIRTWYGKRLDHGIIAFWAMTQQPDVRPEPGADAAVEAIVIVRDEAFEDVVYPFSFVDMSEANEFIRFEMVRGVDPSVMQVFWAVPVQLGVTADGSIRIFPDAAPDAIREALIAPPREFVKSEPVGAAKVSPTVIEWSAAATEDDPIEALFRKVRSGAEDGFEDGEAAFEAKGETVEFTVEAGVGDETRQEAAMDTGSVANEIGDREEASLDETTEDGKIVAEDERVELVEILASDEAEGSPAEGAGEADEATERAGDTAGSDLDAGEQLTDAGTGAFDDAMAPIVAEIITAGEPAGTEFPAGRAFASDKAARINSREELQKVLKVRRWDEQSGPFRGFDSPPGRF